MTIAAFMVRNPGYTLRNIRDLAEVRQAMRAWLFYHPRCAFCGHGGGLQVHHVAPVHVAPERAADPSNMLTLCGRRGCHRIIGHAGDWQQYVEDPRSLCLSVKAGGIVGRA